MRAYLAAIARGSMVDAALEARIRDRLAAALPADPARLRQRRWVKPDRGVGLWTWSDEPDDEDPWFESDRGARVLSGYLNVPFPDLAADLTTGGPATATLEERLASASGVYSVCLVDAAAGGAVAWNTVTRVQPVHWQEHPGWVLVSDRPLLAHLVGLDGAARPTYDVEATFGLLSAGWFPTTGTPYRGLQVLEPDSQLRVTGTAIEVTKRPDHGTGDASAETIAAHLVQACLPIERATDGAVVLNLTGGRDSRLIAAGMRAAGVTFTTSTKGAPTHPDVVVAGLVAKALGVEHSSSAPEATARVRSVDPIGRTTSVLRATDGLLSGFENITRSGSGFGSRIVVSGAGGELLRGGFIKTAPHIPDKLEQFIQRRFTPAQTIAVPEVAARYRDSLLQVVAAADSDDDALDVLYLYSRTGRWASASSMANTASVRLFQPLFDARVIRAARQVPLADRASEHLVFDVISRLAPELATIPLVDRRWAFEQDGPTDDAALDAWTKRAPVRAVESPKAVFDWRLAEDRRLYDELRRQIFSSGAADLFEVLVRSRVEDALPVRPREEIRRTRVNQRARLLWGAYSVATLLGEDWISSQPSRPIEIRKGPPLRHLARAAGLRALARIRR